MARSCCRCCSVLLPALLVAVVMMVILTGVPTGRAVGPLPAVTHAATESRGRAATEFVPTPRQSYGMAYDPLLRELVLFGGEDSSNTPLGDTWVYSHGNWSPVASSVSPAARFAAGIAYDPALGGVILFGGAGSGTFFNDTWLFSDAGWEQLAPAQSPPLTSSINLVYDSTSGTLLLLGSLPVTHALIFWEFTRNTWTNITKTAGTLPPAVWGNLADDPAAHGLLFYGGTNGCFDPEGGLALTWIYANGAWTNVTQDQSLTPVNPMGVTTMGYDPTRDGVVMFSGLTLDCLETDATYLFADGQWTNLTSTVGHPPPPRWNSRLVNVPGVGDIIFSGNENPVGGVNSFGNDTWVLGSTWANVPIVSESSGGGGLTATSVGSTDLTGVAVWVIVVVGAAVAVVIFLRWPPPPRGPSRGH